jgi:putative SOS response-associated peptidase YedK
MRYVALRAATFLDEYLSGGGKKRCLFRTNEHANIDMCGRTAQTQDAVRAAVHLLVQKRRGRHQPSRETNRSDERRQQPTHTNNHGVAAELPDESQADKLYNPMISSYHNNYNLSPGMDALVMIYNHTTQQIELDRQIWGLVPQQGTAARPLPTGMNQHFNNMMYNARLDTLLTKPTFSKLLLQTHPQTAIVIVDGFFEWKLEGAKVNQRKQPYFVHRKQKDQPLLMAGLYTRVNTGREDDPVLSTFTILTTDVCAPLAWLHTRMPVCIWDLELAHEWLTLNSKQSHAVLNRLDQGAQGTAEGCLDWHAVTTKMSSMKFRDAASIQPLPPTRSVVSFFAANAARAGQSAAAASTAAAVTQESSGHDAEGESGSQPTAIPDDPDVEKRSNDLKVASRPNQADKASTASTDEAEVVEIPNDEDSSNGKLTTTAYSPPAKRSAPPSSPPASSGKKQRSLHSFFAKKS